MVYPTVSATDVDVKRETFTSRFLGRKETKALSSESHSSKLLKQITNIDVNDHLNPLLVSEYVDDIYEYLNSMETQLPIRKDYLKESVEVKSKMRTILIDWINEIHGQFNMAVETFFLAVAMIDRYLQTTNVARRKELQLIGVTALFTATKYEDMYPLDVADFAFITDNTYNKREILEMEKKILYALNFELGRPLPIQFLRRFSKAAFVDYKQHGFAKYVIELTAIDYNLCHVMPSKIAAASLLLTMMLSQGVLDWGLWKPTLEHYSKYTADDLKDTVKVIAELVKNANGKLKAVYKKYSTSKFLNASVLKDNQKKILDELITDN